MIYEPYIPDEKDWDFFYELDREISDAVEKADNFKQYENKAPSDENTGIANLDTIPEMDIFNDNNKFL